MGDHVTIRANAQETQRTADRPWVETLGRATVTTFYAASRDLSRFNPPCALAPGLLRAGR